MRLPLKLLLASGLSLLLNGASAADLKAGLGYLPSLAEKNGSGPFVDLLKAIEEVYPEVRIQIEVLPFARSMRNIELGLQDFHAPMMVSPYVDQEKLPYRFVKKPMGQVCHVLYSRKNATVSKEQLFTAVSHTVYPYRIEVIRGAKEFFNFPFPIAEATYFEEGMNRVIKGQSDAFIAAQEEGDTILRGLSGKEQIHRSLLACWDDQIVIPKGPHGDEVDRILTEALNRLESSGRLKKLRQKIHGSYSDWQTGVTEAMLPVPIKK
ncbi:type 2 periplasmic-binding domain-containing protein [Undibacterium curvum]|uniref:ABC transporter substrate-binding protein n=1 Tax=Undibacterium curvum TaxID=2762294 RepID=A0ABR7A8C1_9BURK|nr:ABC transporter substrate-binding protein [Undibacterium curvum]MBC3933112.1 ABC transporter substrate-binding protein [Undibacterium curvum]